MYIYFLNGQIPDSRTPCRLHIWAPGKDEYAILDTHADYVTVDCEISRNGRWGTKGDWHAVDGGLRQDYVQQGLLEMIGLEQTFQSSRGLESQEEFTFNYDESPYERKFMKVTVDTFNGGWHRKFGMLSNGNRTVRTPEGAEIERAYHSAVVNLAKAKIKLLKTIRVPNANTIDIMRIVRERSKKHGPMGRLMRASGLLDI